jgi:protein O-mannosyl-transferase
LITYQSVDKSNHKQMNQPSTTPKTSWMAGAGLLVGICCVVYFPYLQNLFIWDDDKYLTENPYLTDLDGLKQLWFDLGAMPQYYPMVFTSFWIEHQIWALDPLGYHIDNVIIHCLNAIILWRVLSLLDIKGSWLVAAIFSIHPVQAESVAWITERKNLLSGFFYLLSLYFFLRFKNPTPNTQDEHNEKRSWTFYGFSLFLFVCALWSKTVACTLPAAILLIYWWKQNRLNISLILTMIPFFAIGLGFASLTVWLEKFNVGAIGQDWAFSFWDRFLIAGRALWFYIGKLVWPSPIIFTYPRWVIDDSVWWQYIYPLTFLLLIFILWAFRKNIGRGPLTAILFFAGSLFPALGFFSVYPMKYSFVADHFQYLPCIGIIALFTSRVGKLLEERKFTSGFILSTGLLIFFGTLTWNQGPVYRNNFSLWKDTIKKNPAAWMAHNNFGNILAEEGKLKEAISHYRTAIKIKPNIALAHTNLGNTLVKAGMLQEAISQYKTAIKVEPGFFVAQNNLGDTLVKVGELEEAIHHYKSVIKIKPAFVQAQYSLGVALAKGGRIEEAISYYRAVIATQPDYFLAHNNLGHTLTTTGKLEEAILHYRTAIRIKPDYFQAYFNLGNALAAQGDLKNAITQYRIAVTLKPDDAQANNNLGISLAKTGAIDAAMVHFRAAVKAKPDFFMAHNNLGGALLMKKKTREAITHFKAAIKISPDYLDAQKNLRIALLSLKD